MKTAKHFLSLTTFAILLVFSARAAIAGEKADANYNRGVMLYLQGDFKTAVALWKDALADDPDMPELYYALAGAYYERNDLETALMYALVGCGRFKADAYLDELAGTILYRINYVRGNQRNELESARLHLTKAVKANPDSGAAHYYLGLVYYDLGAKESAELELKRAIGLNPADPYPYIALGRMYEGQGKARAALAVYEKGLANIQQDAAEASAIMTNKVKELRSE